MLGFARAVAEPEVVRSIKGDGSGGDGARKEKRG